MEIPTELLQEPMMAIVCKLTDFAPNIDTEFAARKNSTQQWCFSDHVFTNVNFALLCSESLLLTQYRTIQFKNRKYNRFKKRKHVTLQDLNTIVSAPV